MHNMRTKIDFGTRGDEYRLFPIRSTSSRYSGVVNSHATVEGHDTMKPQGFVEHVLKVSAALELLESDTL
tara:strand:- start:125 stop:334 length:210 start_codon:yes stop_codon:yes gene_type:complete